MPGRKRRYTKAEDKLAAHIIRYERKKGYGLKRSKKIAYGFINKRRKRK